MYNTYTYYVRNFIMNQKGFKFIKMSNLSSVNKKYCLPVTDYYDLYFNFSICPKLYNTHISYRCTVPLSVQRNGYGDFGQKWIF